MIYPHALPNSRNVYQIRLQYFLLYFWLLTLFQRESVNAQKNASAHLFDTYCIATKYSFFFSRSPGNHSRRKRAAGDDMVDITSQLCDHLYKILLYSQTKGVERKYIRCISGLVAYIQYIHNCGSQVALHLAHSRESSIHSSAPLAWLRPPG